MANVIHLLPDSVANQIAAGEVIQRPASVVKELVENAIDAGALNITVNIRDAGRTLIQVLDDGHGMTGTDARMAFERHATSKIKAANDLFHLQTMGFRGEALASIAAISQVILQTKTGDEELGTSIEIHGSNLMQQEPVATSKGSNFQVKNLFYNVPARRKFLKTQNTEFRHISNEFIRIVLTRPDIQFTLIHNDQTIYNLPVSNHRQRIQRIFGKSMNKNLVTIESETSIVKISGFIGKPETAKKSFGEQFFFINNRYMRHGVFHKAIMNAYHGLIPHETVPCYFIYFESIPESIDVNIHPTKTEIKFESEQAIFQLLEATAKEGLGKANLVPTIDFDTQGVIEIPTVTSKTEIKPPQIRINPDYDPFSTENKTSQQHNQDNLDNWEQLYQGFQNKASNNQSPEENEPGNNEIHFSEHQKPDRFFHFKGRYIVSSIKSGLLLIDQKRAHERILFEKYIASLLRHTGVSQESLFPGQIELNNEDYGLVVELMEDINRLGFDIREFGRNTVVVNGCPAEIENPDPEKLIHELLAEYKNNMQELKSDYKLNLAKSLATAAAIGYDHTLKPEEMNALADELFACNDNQYSPSGKQIMTVITTDEIEKRLK
ncbi:MAG: DNA mismatch repair endonuclease MutL [Bacteroidetes bacterium]|jgi:DNA mismatch repair protein MutL|nr:DNA mismatch repair endonuclease MutL [Bacteroidota bacterium]